MGKSEIRQIIITLVACVVTGAIVFGITRQDQKKIAVVDAIKLFNGYKMKLELEAQSDGTLKYLSHRADSLKQDVMGKSKIKDFPRTELEGLYTEFRKAQGILEQQYQESNQSINEQVWKRLNPLIDEYGKKKGFRLIIGANGMGSVLYNDDYYDQTAALIEYVNNKYEQGN